MASHEELKNSQTGNALASAEAVAELQRIRDKREQSTDEHETTRRSGLQTQHDKGELFTRGSKAQEIGEEALRASGITGEFAQVEEQAGEIAVSHAVSEPTAQEHQTLA